MLRDLIKNLVASLLYETGLVGFLLRRKLRNRAIVVTYHRVLPHRLRQQSFSHDAIIVTPDLFERHIATLQRHFSCLGLEEFSEKLRSRGFSGRPQCLITFDDAWQDNYTFALPILKRRGASAVIFVPTDYIGSGELFWQERLGHILNQLCQESPDLATTLLHDYGWSQLPAMAEDRRIEEIKTVIRHIKTKSYEEIDDIIETLEAALDSHCDGYGADTYLSANQMREMQQHRVSFQSHGRSHRVFTRLDQQELFEELEGSADWLEKNLGSRPTALAYPNGDHDPGVQQCTAEAGYSLAFTTVSGDVGHDAGPFGLRRINLSDKVAGSEARLLMTLLLAT